MPELDAPIQNLDSLDIVGERKDGGVDLVIVCSGPLDDSFDTLKVLTRKVESYLAGATHPNFSNVHPAAKDGPTRIFIKCGHAVSDAAQKRIASLAQETHARGVELILGDPVA